MAMPEFEAGPVAVRRIEPLAVVALRHLSGGREALAAALRAVGVTDVPEHAQALGSGRPNDNGPSPCDEGPQEGLAPGVTWGG
jgi:hypothetical protein